MIHYNSLTAALSQPLGSRRQQRARRSNEDPFRSLPPRALAQPLDAGPAEAVGAAAAAAACTAARACSGTAARARPMQPHFARVESDSAAGAAGAAAAAPSAGATAGAAAAGSAGGWTAETKPYSVGRRGSTR